VSGQDRQPDVERIEVAGGSHQPADTERHDDLRDDRDVERALGVAGALQTALAATRNDVEMMRYSELIAREASSTHAPLHPPGA
jgi:hypothetical protein